MNKLKSLFLLFVSLSLLSASCKKEKMNLQAELSLLPAATQTGANTFGCLVNGQHFVPHNRSIFEGPVLQCNYIYLNGGYYFNINGGNSSSNSLALDVNIQTDSLAVSEGQILSLTEYNTPGKAAGSYFAASDYGTNANVTGQLSITYMDPIKQIISGTFYFNAANRAGDTVKITNGRFDMHYTR